MRSYKEMNAEQVAAITHIYEWGETFLVAPMGGGKTVVAMTAAQELLRDEVVNRVLIVSSKRVIEDVWPNESAQWDHLHLEVETALGTPPERRAVINSTAKVVGINFENLAWLAKEPAFKQFDMLIIDESTKMKSNGSGVKALRHKLKQFTVRVAMTGTPVSENFEQLFYQIMLVDDGKSLGKAKKAFLHKYFMPLDYMEYNWGLKLGSEGLLVQAFKHLVVELPAAPLPPHTEQIDYVQLEPMQRVAYDALEKDGAIDGVTAANAAVAVNKLQQIASGFSYVDDGGGVIDWSVAKIQTMLAGAINVNGPLVVVYQYQEELARLKKALIHYCEIDQLAKWRKGGGPPYLLIHPKSCGHGIDLTHANQIIFMSPLWSRDLMRQTIARVVRRGQENEVVVRTIVARDTVEEEMIKRVSEKASFHDLLLARLNAR